MQRTKIRIGARCRECKRELVVGVERFRAKRLGLRSYRVRNIVVIDPGDGIAGLHGTASG